MLIMEVAEEERLQKNLSIDIKNSKHELLRLTLSVRNNIHVACTCEVSRLLISFSMVCWIEIRSGGQVYKTWLPVTISREEKCVAHHSR